MWWFLKKAQTRAVEADGNSRLQTEDQLLAQGPDLSSLDKHDVAIKIWLPELVARTLKWVTGHEDVSQSRWVRELLLSYVYGRVAVLAHHIRGRRSAENGPLCSRGPVDRGAGRWIYKVPQLGKNTIAFKIWVSQQMRDDLEILAKHAGVGLSPFVREVIVGDLFGRGSLPERPKIIGMTTDAATAWERDETVPVEQVEEDAFDGLGEAERVWVESQ